MLFDEHVGRAATSENVAHLSRLGSTQTVQMPAVYERTIPIVAAILNILFPVRPSIMVNVSFMTGDLLFTGKIDGTDASKVNDKSDDKVFINDKADWFVNGRNCTIGE